MQNFYNTTMKLKNHKKILGTLSLVSTPQEAGNLLIKHNFAFGATSILLSLLPENIVELIGYIPLGLFLADVAKRIQDNSSIYTDEYFTALEEYKNYITDLSNLFKAKNINDPISVSYIFSNLLITGLLSCDDIKTDEKIKLPKMEKCPELLGTKVMDGSLFSRYAAPLLCDLLNTLGHNCCVLSVEQKKRKRNSSYYNTIVGIIHNKKKFAYDLTNADILYTTKSATTYISTNVKKDDNPIEYTLELNESYNLNKSRMKNLIQYKHCEPENDKLTILERELTATIASLEITTEMTHFNKSHQTQMQKIKVLSNNFYPNRILTEKD